ncbi:Rieske 2Fe-2S domain-containing protein [Pseudonocardia benzenivorans]
MIHAHIYNDPEIFRLEKERLFSRTWLFVAHESEVPQVGDYVVRRVLEDSFIIVRDEHGGVRAMFNMCLHRGMQVCRAEMGNASHFRCPYHGWSYRNDGRLAGLPFHQDAYGGEAGFARAGQRLLPAPALGTYNGLIFLSLDPDAPPLEEFLGDFRFYLDYYTKQSPSGIELRGPQRWRIKANWKIGAENFAGDMYHTPQTHISRGDRAVPRAQGREAQGRGHLLGRQRRRHHLQAPLRHPGGAVALCRLPRRDDRADEE